MTTPALTQVAGNALADADGQHVVGDRQDAAQKRQQEHHARSHQHDGEVVPPDADIDDALDEPREREIDHA